VIHVAFQTRVSTTVTGNEVKVEFAVPMGSEVREITGSIKDRSVFKVNDGITRVLGWISDPVGTIPVRVEITSLNSTDGEPTYLIRTIDRFIASGKFTLTFYALLTDYQGEVEPFRVVFE